MPKIKQSKQEQWVDVLVTSDQLQKIKEQEEQLKSAIAKVEELKAALNTVSDMTNQDSVYEYVTTLLNRV